MGSIGGRKALQVIANVEKILAIELLTATQAFEFRKPLKSSIFLNAIHTAIRKEVAFAACDRVFADDIEKGIQMIQRKTIIRVIDQMTENHALSLTTPYTNLFETY